jgi:hypothetical protein
MSRQRFVYDTAHVSHLWAHQAQSEARNSRRNLYFYGDTIFSYGAHFPIARHIKHRGKSAILFTSRTYSVTTAGHISMVRQAIPLNVAVFTTFNPLGSLADVRSEHKERVTEATKRLAAAKSKAQRAIRYRALVAVIAEANRFSEYFGFTTRYRLPENHAELDAIATAYETALEGRRQARWAKHRERMAAIEAEREKERAERAAKMPELIERWRNGEACLSYWEFNSLPTLLRIKGDVVETSRGAEFPVEQARRALPIVRSLLKHGRPYERNGHAIHLGHYVIDSIDEEGTIHAGCHTVRRDETERLISNLEQTP